MNTRTRLATCIACDPVAAPLLQLMPGEVHRLTGTVNGLRLVVLRGRLWVTQAGTPQDHFVAAGGELLLQGRGAVVMECDGAEPAELRVVRAARVVRQQVRFAAALRRLFDTPLPGTPLLETRPPAVHPRLRRAP